MSGNRIGRAVRRLLGLNALHHNGGFGDHDVEVTFQRGQPTSVKVFRCGRCHGVTRARRAPMCSGVDGRHADHETRMTRIDAKGAPANTDRLQTR